MFFFLIFFLHFEPGAEPFERISRNVSLFRNKWFGFCLKKCFNEMLQNMANFDAFHWKISSSINLLFLKSGLGLAFESYNNWTFFPIFSPLCTICFYKKSCVCGMSLSFEKLRWKLVFGLALMFFHIFLKSCNILKLLNI